MELRIFREFTQHIKVAGMELGLHGYHSEPEDAEKEQASDELWKSAPSSKDFALAVPRKGLLNRLLRRTDKRVDSVAYSAALRKWAKGREDTAWYDPFEQRSAARIKTPYLGRDSKNKLIAHVLSNAPSSLHDVMTDFAYRQKPIEHRLDKAGIRKVLKHYNESAGLYDQPGEREAHRKFNAHTQALLRDPKLKFARLELG